MGEAEEGGVVITRSFTRTSDSKPSTLGTTTEDWQLRISWQPHGATNSAAQLQPGSIPYNYQGAETANNYSSMPVSPYSYWNGTKWFEPSSWKIIMATPPPIKEAIGKEEIRATATGKEEIEELDRHWPNRSEKYERFNVNLQYLLLTRKNRHDRR